AFVVLASLAFSAGAQVNVAAAVNGGVATASSTYSAGFPVSSVIDGDRIGANWGNGGGWNDGTFWSYPDWVQINFNKVYAISEIDVFTIQDSTPVNPTPTMTFATYGATSYEVQYWNGSAWVDVPGGNITGNNLVWRKFTFSTISTDRIRVLVKDGADHVCSRLIEVEAWAAMSATLNAPTAGALLSAPAAVNLSSTATDMVGTIGRVEFYRDSTLVATVTSPSSGTTTSGTYTASDSNVPAGTYSYTAK